MINRHTEVSYLALGLVGMLFMAADCGPAFGAFYGLFMVFASRVAVSLQAMWEFATVIEVFRQHAALPPADLDEIAHEQRVKLVRALVGYWREGV